MKYIKPILLLLCLVLLAGCAEGTPEASQPTNQTVEEVTSPYLQSQGEPKPPVQGDVDKAALLKECTLLAEGELALAGEGEYRFSVTALYKGTAEGELRIVTQQSLQAGKCMLALQAQADGSYTLSHGQASYLLPAEDGVYTNSSLTLDPTTLPSDLLATEE